MNHEKKLEYFAQAIAREVEAKKTAARKRMTADMKTAVSNAVRDAEAEAELRIISEEQALQKAESKSISEAKAQARRAIASLREELAARLFEDVRADAAAFTQNGGYESYIVDGIREAVADARHTFSYVQLAPSDMRLSKPVQEATGLTPEAGSESDVGGFRLLTANRKMSVDFTFKARIENAAEDFHAAHI